jgi:hypothetical protein
VKSEGAGARAEDGAVDWVSCGCDDVHPATRRLAVQARTKRRRGGFDMATMEYGSKKKAQAPKENNVLGGLGPILFTASEVAF